MRNFLRRIKYDIQTILHKSTLIEEGTLNRFTGFVDREGKEIYESDEVEDLRKDTFIVNYNDYFGAWELSRGVIARSIDRHYCEAFLKVRGNSYETYTKYQETYIN